MEELVRRVEALEKRCEQLENRCFAAEGAAVEAGRLVETVNAAANQAVSLIQALDRKTTAFHQQVLGPEFPNPAV